MTEPSAGASIPTGCRGVPLRDPEPLDPEADPSRRPSLEALVGVALGAAVGATGRFALYQSLPGGPPGLPWATLTVNVTGSLLLGVVLGALSRSRTTPRLRAVVAAGVLGTYTTFSTFVVDAALLVRAGLWWLALTYVAASLSGGLGTAWLGLRAGRMLGRREGSS